ncbi:Ig-like domain-containing protein [Candidatus Poribacteria bacterium]|nr:Ig-like domain-containing protein [Candidatus Poribacteria bacterium]
MRDDGTNGDAIGGDKIFTLRLTVTEQNPGEMRLQVSAAFLKTLKRVLSDIVVIPVLLPPMPPILNPIGNQTVALGSTLTLNLTASDPNNDPLAFSATPLPLPDNASLNAMTGSFTFSPAANQVGDILLTFTVSDGVFSDSETVTIYRSGSAARRRHRADRTHPGYQ